MKHAHPQVDANRVIAADQRLLRFQLPAFPFLIAHPVRGKAFRRGLQQQTQVRVAQGGPRRAKTHKIGGQLRRKIAGVKPPAAVVGKTDFSRQQHRAKARHRHRLFVDNPRQQRFPGLGVMRLLPQAPRLQQRPGYPQIRVGCRIAVQQRPLFVVLFPPQPARQMLPQVALRQVVLRPGQQLVEPRAIVGRQGKEQAIALSFGSGNFARIAGVDHPPLGADVRFLKLLPGGPLASGARLARRQYQRGEHRAAKYFHHRLFIIQAKAAAADNAQHAPQHPRQQHELTAAKIASSIGWLESANQMRSNQGRWPT
ncbi:hypothetical protein SB01124_00167 [Klebsiella quasipneumoniae subsp. quasipneumoniae]|nr:hypothetical protein SB01124_00167 [Klebsiella quasipneumoniae subsp. quasipneumoniae]